MDDQQHGDKTSESAFGGKRTRVETLTDACDQMSWDQAGPKYQALAEQLERELSTARSAVVASDLRWLTPDEVTEPGNYIREDSEEVCVVEMAKQRVHPPVAESYTQDALACQGSFYRADWGDAKFYGPISLQALLKDRQSITAMTGLLAKARRERDEARTPRSATGVLTLGEINAIILRESEGWAIQGQTMVANAVRALLPAMLIATTNATTDSRGSPK